MNCLPFVLLVNEVTFHWNSMGDELALKFVYTGCVVVWTAESTQTYCIE